MVCIPRSKFENPAICFLETIKTIPSSQYAGYKVLIENGITIHTIVLLKLKTCCCICCIFFFLPFLTLCKTNETKRKLFLNFLLTNSSKQIHTLTHTYSWTNVARKSFKVNENNDADSRGGEERKKNNFGWHYNQVKLLSI